MELRELTAFVAVAEEGGLFRDTPTTSVGSRRGRRSWRREN